MSFKRISKLTAYQVRNIVFARSEESIEQEDRDLQALQSLLINGEKSPSSPVYESVPIF